MNVSNGVREIMISITQKFGAHPVSHIICYRAGYLHTCNQLVLWLSWHNIFMLRVNKRGRMQ